MPPRPADPRYRWIYPWLGVDDSEPLAYIKKKIQLHTGQTTRALPARREYPSYRATFALLRAAFPATCHRNLQRSARQQQTQENPRRIYRPAPVTRALPHRITQSLYFRMHQLCCSRATHHTTHALSKNKQNHQNHQHHSPSGARGETC